MELRTSSNRKSRLVFGNPRFQEQSGLSVYAELNAKLLSILEQMLKQVLEQVLRQAIKQAYINRIAVALADIYMA